MLPPGPEMPPLDKEVSVPRFNRGCAVTYIYSGCAPAESTPASMSFTSFSIKTKIHQWYPHLLSEWHASAHFTMTLMWYWRCWNHPGYIGATIWARKAFGMTLNIIGCSTHVFFWQQQTGELLAEWMTIYKYGSGSYYFKWKQIKFLFLIMNSISFLDPNKPAKWNTNHEH